MKRKNPYSFVISIILLAASGIFPAVMLHQYSNEKFWVTILPVAIFTILALIEIFIAEKNSLKFVAKLNEAVSTAENEVLYYSDSPCVILDISFRVLWCNRKFSNEIIPDYEIFGLNLNEYIPINFKELLISGITKAQYHNNYYEVTSVVIERGDQRLTVVNFNNITEFAELYDEYKRTRPSVLILTIDNYEDVMQNFKESEKAHVAASIETVLEEFMTGTTGVMRKLSQDKFIAVLEEQYLSEIIHSKFQILDKARNITVGEKTNFVTLSIGVGQGASTLEESEVYAKQALDMALGRGGDQAAVKTENGFKFFGGVAKGVEKKSRAKSRIISTAMQELIHNSENVFIMGHRFGDLDSVGSAAALASAVRVIGQEAYAVIDPEKNLAGMLIDKIKKEAPDIIISPDEAVNKFTEESLLIIVDTHNANLIESKHLYNSAKHIVVIDHHRKSVDFIDNAVIFHHEPYASSAAEMVTELIQYFKATTPLSKTFSEALLAGIMLDTKNFIMRTGVRTFEAAAYLRKCGADTVQVKGLFTSSIEAYKEKSFLISHAEIISKCAVVCCEKETDNIRITAPQAADELLGIQNVDASFVIYRTGTTINISARSLGAMNVQVIMEKLGGGGHQTMAAAQLKDTTAEAAKAALIEAINED